MCAGDDFDYDGIAMGQIVQGVDAFYGDFRNKQLGLTLAMEYVRDEIKGKSPEELESKVINWRRCSAVLQMKDAEQIKKLACPIRR